MVDAKVAMQILIMVGSFSVGRMVCQALLLKGLECLNERLAVILLQLELHLYDHINLMISSMSIIP